MKKLIIIALLITVKVSAQEMKSTYWTTDALGERTENFGNVKFTNVDQYTMKIDEGESYRTLELRNKINSQRHIFQIMRINGQEVNGLAWAVFGDKMFSVIFGEQVIVYHLDKK